MKILLSASAFSHKWGSEPGVGWNWAMQLSKDHELVVLTHGYFRSHMQEYVDAHGPLPFRVIYQDMLPLRDVPDTVYMNSTVHFLRWQWTLRPMVKELLKHERFDLIHHLTLGTLRYPSFLQKLGVPMVAGPLGGGERAPVCLYQGLPWKIRIREMVRDLLIFSAAWDPLVNWAWSRTDLLICRTKDSRKAMPWHVRKRTLVIQEIGCPAPDSPTAPMPALPPQKGRLRCLSVGRVIGLKGLHIGLEAMARLRERGITVELNIIGDGDAQAHLEQQAERLGLSQQLKWLGKLPRDEVMRHYKDHDLVLFPSLHDSGGTVVLESISQGCPVVCLDLGGPPHFINETCGRVVEVGNRSMSEVIDGLAQALEGLAQNPDVLLGLRQGAIDQAIRLSWTERVRGAYAQIREKLRIR